MSAAELLTLGTILKLIFHKRTVLNASMAVGNKYKTMLNILARRQVINRISTFIPFFHINI